MKQHITKLPRCKPSGRPFTSGVIAEGEILFVSGQDSVEIDCVVCMP